MEGVQAEARETECREMGVAMGSETAVAGTAVVAMEVAVDAAARQTVGVEMEVAVEDVSGGRDLSTLL